MSIEAWALLVVFTVIAIVVLIFVLSPKKQKIPKTTLPRRIVGESVPLPFDIVGHVGEKMAATEMLSRIQALRRRNAQWEAIFQELNPTTDSEVQQLLTEIRGPNMFAPHVGLSVIEDGCKLTVLTASPNSNALDALRREPPQPRPIRARTKSRAGWRLCSPCASRPIGINPRLPPAAKRVCVLLTEGRRAVRS